MNFTVELQLVTNLLLILGLALIAHQIGQLSNCPTNSHHSSDEVEKPIAWINGKSNNYEYLVHVVNVFERLGYKVHKGRLDKRVKWSVLWNHEYPFSRPDLLSEINAVNSKQRINHIPGSGFITSKVFLAQTPLKSGVPLALSLPKQKHELLDFARKNPSIQWVTKSNSHREIEVANLDEIDLDKKDVFVQEFVKNPLLVDQRKFDLGVYVVVTSLSPLRVYIYEGDILLRFCSQDYHPFDHKNLDKYVVGDDYTPIWEMPSFHKTYNEQKLSTRASFSAYLIKQNKSLELIWQQIQQIVREVFELNNEKMRASLSKYKHSSAFFELTRFDFLIDDHYKVYLMEANMSPNLSSGHFKENALLYEQVLFNLFSLVGLAGHIHADSLTNVEVSDRDIAVQLPECLNGDCKDCSNNTKCGLCSTCMDKELRGHLRRAYKEHLNRKQMRRVVPSAKSTIKLTSVDQLQTVNQFSSKTQPQQVAKEYVLKTEKIDLYFQRIALMAVLKAKAHRILKTKVAGNVDELLYLRCANNAKTPVILAQCIVKLMKARDNKLELANTPAQDPWQTDWFKELRKLLWPSAESKTPRPFPDSSQSAPIFSPNLDPNKQKMVDNFRNQIRKIKSKPTQHPLKYLPPHLSIHRIPAKSRESSPMKRRFYTSNEDETSKLPLKGPKQFASFLQRRDLFSARSKRQANETSQFPNIENLRNIEKFFAQSQFCQNYMRRLQQNNQGYLRKFTDSIKYNNHRQENFVSNVAGEFNQIFNDNTFEKLSVLSPRILSLMPDSGKKRGLLSESILGFHQNGLLSMPDLLRIAASDDHEMLEWLEWLMQMSGTGKHLNQLMDKIKDDVEQAKRIYDGDNVPSYTQMSPTQQDLQLEKWIEKISKLDASHFEDSKLRHKRQEEPSTTTHEPPPNPDGHNDTNRPPHLGEDDFVLVFEPYVFLNQINEHVLLDGLILSPHAFVNEMLVAETLPFDVLTPRAFIASTLSAQALGMNIFCSGILYFPKFQYLEHCPQQRSGQSPEALIAYVVTPRILEARIGSPEGLVFMVLSPGIINPRIYSGEYYALLVLSPHILSPRIQSPEQYVVEILSPHIFGGSHESHHDAAIGIAEDHAAGHEIHSQSQPHGTNDDGTHVEQPLESIVGASPHHMLQI
ncbi:hypothetical protein M3Y97_00764200 [Aphelenchoides bicaudatus]|nr:hypothetical protein M3Y97_00764200 [Aphelenchoides bicaudatus]